MIILLLENWLFIIILMTLVFCLYLKIKNPGIIDVFWPITIFISGAHYFFHHQHYSASLILVALLFVWAARLSLYLFLTRILPNIIEKRYAFVDQDSPEKSALRFFMHYQFQGILGMMIALPFYFIGQNTPNLFLILFSSVIILAAIIFESLCDFQLQQFRMNHKGRVCDIGFWRYSRHPNYFFEWLIWMGFALAAFSLYSGLVAFLSPFLLLLLMLKITIPITENASLASRGQAYRDYQKKTPVFFPVRFEK